MASLNNCTDTTCNSSSFPQFRCEIPPFSPPNVPEWIDYVYAAAVLLIIMLSITLNSLVLFLVTRSKELRQRAFLLSLQIVVLHLIFTSTVLSTVFITAVRGEWLFGDVMCQIIGVILDGLASVRFLLMLVLTLDRIFTVFLPFYYARHGTQVSVLMSIAVWAVSAVRVVIPLTGVLDCYTYVPTFSTCTAVLNCSDQCAIFIYMTFSITIFLGAIVPAILYIFLFWKARKLLWKTRSSDYRRQSIISIKGIRTGGGRLEKHDKRAMITFLILFISLLGCTLPAFILYFSTFSLSGPPHPVAFSLQKLVGRVLFFSLTVADPLVVMRTRDVKEALRKTFCKFRRHRFTRTSQVIGTGMTNVISAQPTAAQDSSSTMQDSSVAMQV